MFSGSQSYILLDFIKDSTENANEIKITRRRPRIVILLKNGNLIGLTLPSSAPVIFVYGQKIANTYVKSRRKLLNDMREKFKRYYSLITNRLHFKIF